MILGVLQPGLWIGSRNENENRKRMKFWLEQNQKRNQIL